MTEGPTFSDLVQEAFIDPLRSVLIVDDQYPTWEEVLNNSKGGGQGGETVSPPIDKEWRTDPSGPLGIISQFRCKNPGFVIDIHDALVPAADGSTLQKPESPAALANHLHQSDLLVLDYNLEGEGSGLKGEAARSILSSVLENSHFNLIIVHTGEHSLDDVLFDCLLSSMAKYRPPLDKSKLQALDERIEELEDSGDFDRTKLSDNFAVSQYVEFRNSVIEDDKGLISQYMRGSGPLASLKQWAEPLELSNGDLRIFLYWAVRELEKHKSSLFRSAGHKGLKWGNESDCKWLRTSRGFVVFVSKGTDDLLGELKKAIERWQPAPSRLLSAKYRHELNRVGVESEDRTLKKSQVFAHFYSDIYGSDTSFAAGKLKDHVSRQSETTTFYIEDEVIKFGQKIVDIDRNTGCKFLEHYGVDLSDVEKKKAAAAYYNSYISTLPLKLGNDQLDSGHILKIEEDWWLCATPACDLQPGQNSIAFKGSSDHLRPFTALRLNKVDVQSLSPTHINSGDYSFISLEEEELVALGLTPLEKGANGVKNNKVTWRNFLAKKSGLIKDNRIDLLIPKLENTNLINDKVMAEVVAKLRYEYALNYIQKVGISVSRIGLGYTSVGEG